MSDVLPEGRITGPIDFAQWVRQFVHAAADESWPQLCLFDPDFSAWPLGDRQVVDDLTRWGLSGGSLQMMARDFRPLTQRSPRFVEWRRRFDHRFEARAMPRTGADEPKLALWSPQWVLVALDRPGAVYVATREASVRAQLRQEWDSAWPLGAVAFPASTLGL